MMADKIIGYSNVATLTVIFTLVVYHIILFIGRKEEKYFLYFSCLGGVATLYILSRIFKTTGSDPGLMKPWGSSSQSLLVFLSGLFVFYIFGEVIKISKEDRKVAWYIFVFLYIIPIITTLTAFFDINLFIKYIWKKNIIALTIGLFSTFLYIAFLITKYKKWKSRIVIILFIGQIIMSMGSAFLGILATFMYKGLESSHIHYGIALFVYAYALSKKFNDEYKRLIVSEAKNKDYAETLELKVEQRTHELKEANSQLEEANRQKTDFLINLAHETKTPLTLIQNYFDKYIKTHDLHDDLKIVKQNLDKLTKDIINSFDVEKIQQGKLIYNHDKISDFGLQLAHNIIIFNELALNKNIKIHTAIDDNCYIKADPFAIERIINNLLENAIRYGYKNTIIEIKLSKNNDNLIFSITNDSPGISQQEQENLFNPYYQLSRTKKNTQGIGMGLNIVKQAVDSLYGKITITSEPNQETTFTVTLKKHTPNEHDKIETYNNTTQTPVITSQPIENTKPPVEGRHTLLIVEDNHDLLNYLHTELSETYNIFTALNGKDALTKLSKIENTDLIISDIMMDEMDGITLLENAMKDEDLKHIPFIFLTAKMEETALKNALKKGAIEYLTKPFDMNNLKYRINNLLNFKTLNEKNTKMKIMLELKDDFTKKCEKYCLTKAEVRIIEAAVSLPINATGTDIAVKLSETGYFLSSRTIRNTLSNIGRKIDVYGKSSVINFFKET